MDPQLEQKLHRLQDLFLEENKKLNLSALREPEQCWIGNVTDSLALLDILPRLFVVKQERMILDLGTGGGFPLLPLALALPDFSFTGIDATKKKIDAIERIRSAMEIRNVRLFSGRAEDFGRHPEFREQFDLVTARAVAPISVLLEYAMPFLKVAARAVFWKSMHIAEEQREAVGAMKKLSCELIFTHTYDMPAGWGSRQLLVYEKKQPTTEEFPRIVGMAKKAPL